MARGTMAPAAPVTVVIATRDRVGELRRTLAHLACLPESPAVIVVDNGSRDGTAKAVRSEFPWVTVIRNRRDRKAAARNQGAHQARTPYVAFSDDDSWWVPGALEQACDLLARHQDVAAIAARTLAGAGFAGCAVVARREAFLWVGGYSRLLGTGGEEELLALDLAAAGWTVLYADAVVARHFPSAGRNRAARRSAELRNRVLVAWLRRPLPRALGGTGALARQACRDPVARRALAGLLLRLPVALATRHPLAPELVEQGVVPSTINIPNGIGLLSAPVGPRKAGKTDPGQAPDRVAACGRRVRSPGAPPTPAACGARTAGSRRRCAPCSAPPNARWSSTWASAPRR